MKLTYLLLRNVFIYLLTKYIYAMEKEKIIIEINYFNLISV